MTVSARISKFRFSFPFFNKTRVQICVTIPLVTSVTVPLFIVIADSCNSHTLLPLGRLKSGTVTNVTFVTSVNYH